MIPAPITLLALASAPAQAAAAHAVARTEAAVIAADESWSAAEQRGDAAFLEWLLEPGYVSVAADGKVHDKAAIVAHAASANARPAGDRAAEVAAWRATHPIRTQVAIFGTTAVVSFVSLKDGSVGAVNSSDVFIYRDGHWHPVYSQHSDAGA